MNDQFKCPDCDATFASPRSLGPHRRAAHGYSVRDGKNNPKRSAKVTRNKNIAYERHRGHFPCQHCDFVAQWTGGLKLHMKKHLRQEKAALAQIDKDAPTITAQNGHVQTTDDGNHRLEAAATFAAGRVAQLLEGIALQHDLPPRTLTALVLRTVHTTTLR